MRRIFSVLLCIGMCFTLICSSANATTAEELEGGLHETIYASNTVSPLAATVPTRFYNLGGNNQYTATLIDLAATRGSYTSYYFATATGYMYFKCDLIHSGTTTNMQRQLTIEVYQRINDYYGMPVRSATINYSSLDCTVRRTVTGLDPNRFYFVLFRNTSSSSASSSLDISGTILIDDTYN